MNCRLSKNPRLEYITANTGNLYSHHIVTMGKSVATLQLLMGCCKTSSEADGRTDTTVEKNKTLDWSTRMNIALQTANGLLYLHEGCKPSIIHRDMKADNILLDNNFKVKVADFSLSSFLDTRNVHHISSICRGTNVYADKEFGDVQKITDKLDVYSYGVILLELITGRKPLHEGSNITIVQWAKNRIGQALNNDDYTRLVDSRLKEYKENEMLRMIYCAAASVYKPSFSRPNMNQIFRILQGTMRPEQIMKRKDIISLLDDMPQDAQMYQMKKYSFIELARATDFFSNDHLLGEGFGQVFRGILDGEVVAIKKVKILNLENYLEEIEQLSILSHPNIVKVIGYCVEKSNRLLVSECVPNGSLEHHLHYARDTILDWSKRMKIATNSAKGLLHLHEGSILKIIHGNIKAANILLDKDFEPKVADIMLAAMLPNFDSFRSLVANVYRDAEDRDRRISDKSDVYSFGVILLELISGRKLLDKQGDIIAWAKNRIGQALNNNVYVDLVDPKLQEYNEDEMKRMICCAAASIYKAARFRPTMKQIVEVLQGSIPWTSIWNNDNNYL
ncbi:proline-rich receptor-like protein kinase PERK15 isoform X3 [Hevea brasiliensis]|uniref:proline-rich receptor-like protein kinase PERK15 isoform X3 n=1 Tax=Hevea brasiliensis TaxID=3981 RepID=UPI0025F1E085|nr:proline-rich receptor-like protein kinase PERK15 isoform X3 [Hevea brasiliensis]